MTQSKSFVSVIINVHNGEKYLAEAISSVLSQSHKNLELIIWDNCSEDRTREIALSFLKSDSRVKVFSAESFQTLYQARNSALETAGGEFFAYLDSDDMWRADKLELAVKCMEQNTCAVFFSNLEILNERTGERRIAYYADLPSGAVFQSLLANYVVAISSVVFRRSVLKTASEFFDPRFNIIGDFDLVIWLAASFNFCSSKEPLLISRQHSSNLSKVLNYTRKSEIQLWFKNSRIINRISKRDFETALFSLIVDASLAKNYFLSAHEVIKLLLNPRFHRLVFKKLIWFAKNRPKKHGKWTISRT
jgi:glycosyltransferase involved in cell wall biosynthesis